MKVGPGNWQIKVVVEVTENGIIITLLIQVLRFYVSFSTDGLSFRLLKYFE